MIPSNSQNWSCVARFCVLPLLTIAALVGDGNALIDTLRNDGPNTAQKDHLTKNYYQSLLEGSGSSADARTLSLARRLTGVSAAKRAFEVWQENPISRACDGFLTHEIVPNFESTHAGAIVRSNRWGMRGDDVQLEKPPGVFRIALLGSSNDIGWGVSNEDTYGQRLAKLLNARNDGRRYELLNFSVPDYSLPEQLWVLEHRALSFSPDLILLATNLTTYRAQVTKSLAERVKKQRPLHYDFLAQIVARAGVSAADRTSDVVDALLPFRAALYEGAFDELRRIRVATGVPIAIVVMRLEAGGSLHPRLSWIVEAARRRDLPALSVFDAFAERPASQLYRDPAADHHPTAAAHGWIAQEILADMLAEQRLRELFRAPPEFIKSGD